MKIVVDTDRCVGSGQCVTVAANVFDQRDEDGVVMLIDDDPADGEYDNVRRAVALCPAAALYVTASPEC